MTTKALVSNLFRLIRGQRIRIDRARQTLRIKLALARGEASSAGLTRNHWALSLIRAVVRQRPQPLHDRTTCSIPFEMPQS